jgi:glutamate--cysteine ligase
MTEGIDGHRATMGDFELHLSTVFPEVRLKRYIEVRSGDGGPVSHMTALPALWKGILYDQAARRAVYERLRFMDRDALLELMDETSKAGIHGTMPNGESIHSVLGEILSLARQGLDRMARDDGHSSEAGYLDVLDEILATRQSQADRLVQTVKTGATRAEVLHSLAL